MRGVECVRVDGCKNEIVVTRKTGTASDGQLIMALRMIGKRAAVIPVESTVLCLQRKDRRGSTQQACSALRRLQGVRAVETQSGDRAQVTFDRRRVQVQDLVAAVSRQGYTARVERRPTTASTPSTLPRPTVRHRTPTPTTTVSHPSPSRRTTTTTTPVRSPSAR